MLQEINVTDAPNTSNISPSTPDKINPITSYAVSYPAPLGGIVSVSDQFCHPTSADSGALSYQCRMGYGPNPSVRGFGLGPSSQLPPKLNRIPHWNVINQDTRDIVTIYWKNQIEQSLRNIQSIKNNLAGYCSYMEQQSLASGLPLSNPIFAEQINDLKKQAVSLDTWMIYRNSALNNIQISSFSHLFQEERSDTDVSILERVQGLTGDFNYR